MPLVGVAFTTATFSIDTNSALGATGFDAAGATTYGATFHGGFAVALTPGTALKFRGGYRLIPASTGPLEGENDAGQKVSLRDSNGQPFEVFFDGPFGLASFELTF